MIIFAAKQIIQNVKLYNDSSGKYFANKTMRPNQWRILNGSPFIESSQSIFAVLYIQQENPY